ncbi:hypothetical protein chiPu_0002647 [Chiloscyllium punctatum]|uniref:Uncharacterized protein n=1 Tax=Chiloscyllium punctatum TaxID=137246 RepID=A0A401S1J1_CHIPU|nr:hypothetical protein [Chiloscyllium punctatum]
MRAVVSEGPQSAILQVTVLEEATVSLDMEDISQNVIKKNKVEPAATAFLLNETLKGRSLGKARLAIPDIRPGLRTGSAAFHGSKAAMHKDYMKAIQTDEFAIHPYSTFRC